MKYDIIIVGGGLVGASLALALRDSGLRIALVDATLPNANDARLFALNHGSCQFLTNLELWPQLSEYASPIHQVHVSYQGHFGALRLDREDVNLSSLGHVIPARYIEQALNAELTSLTHLQMFRPARLKILTQQEDNAVLTIETETGDIVLESAVVIGADGTDSTVRKQLNIKTDIHDYQQSALVTRAMLQRPHHQIAYERFTQAGVIAMLPLPDQECATIWTASHEQIEQLMAVSDADFLIQLQSEFGHRLGVLQAIGKRFVYPLRMVRAEEAVHQCVYLLGNAAHTLNPVAAQGFNLALYEVAVLAEGILEKSRSQEAFTSADLRRLHMQTQKQQATSIGVSHRLSQLFANPGACQQAMMSLGMVGLDLARPLKRQFIKRIMGKADSVPHLLLGAYSL